MVFHETSHLDGLSCQRVYRPGGPHLEFIIHHMSQSLIIHNTKVDVRRELLACDSRIHGLIAKVIVTSGKKLISIRITP